jgi:hypothetical protein
MMRTGLRNKKRQSYVFIDPVGSNLMGLRDNHGSLRCDTDYKRQYKIANVLLYVLNRTEMSQG